MGFEETVAVLNVTDEMGFFMKIKKKKKRKAKENKKERMQARKKENHWPKSTIDET